MRALDAAVCSLLFGVGCAALAGLEDDYGLTVASGGAGAGSAGVSQGGTGGEIAPAIGGEGGGGAGGTGESTLGGRNQAGEAQGGVGAQPPLGEGGAAGAGGASVVECEPGCSGKTPICVQGECRAPRSCAGLADECGASLAGPCCVQDEIPGDEFKRDYDAVGASDATRNAQVSTFSLDRMEVTVGRFRAFVEAGGGTKLMPPEEGSGQHPRLAGSGWKASFNESLVSTKVALVEALSCDATFRTWVNDGAASSNENRPINCVTWYEAFAFCAWDGGRLPTETEWNFAAAGGNEQRVFPWSTPSTAITISPALASYYVDATKQCYGDGKNGCAAGDIVVAGSKGGDGLFDTLDLAGNLNEWVLDFYSEQYAKPCNDCARLDPTPYRSVRGGAFGSDVDAVKATARNYESPLERRAELGFRCAY